MNEQQSTNLKNEEQFTSIQKENTINGRIFNHLDLTILSPTATINEVILVCERAIHLKAASVCIPPCYVKKIRKIYPALNICTVIGFPLGNSTTKIKCKEAKEAIKNGANEIDMVINLGFVKDDKFDKIAAEIQAVKKSIGAHTLKVIVETCKHSHDQLIKICECLNTTRADYIKTSTGFAEDGAKLENINLIKKYINENIKIKASGGIKTIEQARLFIEAGCDRIGASSIT